MEPEFLTFRRFNDLTLAKQLTTLLDGNHIEYEVEENSLVANPLLVSGDEFAKEFCIKLRREDFNNVNALLVADEEQAIDDVEPDYYLFGFSDEELKEIIINYDEWSAFDFALSRKILKDKGISIDDKEIENIKSNRISVLEKPEKSQTLWIIIAYISALLGGILGIFIGWMLWRFKKTLPNGERVYAYVDGDRKHGMRIFTLGIVVFLICFVWRLYNRD